MPYALWWAFGFVSALLMISILQHAGINPGTHLSGLAILAATWAISGFNAIRNS